MIKTTTTTTTTTARPGNATRFARPARLHGGVALLAMLLLAAPVARAQAPAATQAAAATTGPATSPSGGADVPPEIQALRDGLIDSFNKRDVDRMLSYLHPDIVVTWQNAEVSHGREGVRQYYNKMLTGPDAIVKEMGTAPQVEGRKTFGDTSISYGKLNDWFKLKDGLEVRLDSRFSAHLAKGGDGTWLVSGFHASTDAFENPVMFIAARKAATYSGAIAGVIGVVVGLVLGLILGRRRAPAAATARR